MQQKRIFKVLMCCLGPETHNRGILTVSGMLRDAGMEVVYLGNATPEEALKIAIDEDVQAIGVSSLSGAHLSIGKLLMNLAKEEECDKSIGFHMGGVIPPKDIPKLREMGFDGVFPSGASREVIVNGVLESIQKKTAN